MSSRSPLRLFAAILLALCAQTAHANPITSDSEPVIVLIVHTAHGKTCLVFFRITDAMGSIVNPQSAIGNRLGFQGRANFGELGLQYFRNRFYSPDTGRFISSDPLGMVDGPNTYGFCGGDPVNRSDPMGTDWELYGVDGRLMDTLPEDQEDDARHWAKMTGGSFKHVPNSVQAAPIAAALMSAQQLQTLADAAARAERVRFNQWQAQQDAGVDVTGPAGQNILHLERIPFLNMGPVNLTMPAVRANTFLGEFSGCKLYVEGMEVFNQGMREGDLGEMLEGSKTILRAGIKAVSAACVARAGASLLNSLANLPAGAFSMTKGGLQLNLGGIVPAGAGTVGSTAVTIPVWVLQNPALLKAWLEALGSAVAQGGAAALVNMSVGDGFASQAKLDDHFNRHGSDL